MIPIYVGYDPRESAVYHVFCQSVIENSTVPVSFIPLNQRTLRVDGQRDGTNQFIYSRYLVPYLQDYEGWALFCDGDMVCRGDIRELWSMRDETKAVQVVKHNYKTKNPRKYIGSRIEADNVDYPCKNWSSVLLFNCSHPSNRLLTPEFVADSTGAILHRFQWLRDEDIGGLPHEWNHLVGEYDYDPDAKLVHYTLGAPGFQHYMRCDYHEHWNTYLKNAIHLDGERAEEIVRRATWRSDINFKDLVAI